MQQVDGEKPAESAAGGSNVSATAPAAGQEDEVPKPGGEFRECSGCPAMIVALQRPP